MGVGGQRMIVMLADYATRIAPLYDSEKTNVLIFWEDANQIFNGAGSTDSELITIQNDYSVLAKATGYEYQILVNSHNVRKNLDNTWNAAYTEAKRNYKIAYNSRVISEQIGNVDKVVDLIPNSKIGGEIGLIYDTNYFQDQIHPNYAGYMEVYNEILVNGIMKLFKA
jgi:hypothetical protein